MQKITEDIHRAKYAYGEEKTIADTLRRVADGVYAKDPSAEAKAEALELLLDGSILPAGRILAGAGTGKRVTLINCLSADTRVMTRDGIKAIAALQNSGAEFLTHLGFELGEVRSFGKQPMQEIDLKPATFRKFGVGFAIATFPKGKWTKRVKATPNHRWPLSDGRWTTELAVGDLVKAVRADNVEPDPEGIIHGLIFGDGSFNYKFKEGDDSSFVLSLFGDRVEKYKNLFENIRRFPCMERKEYQYQGSVRYRSGKNLKQVPESNDSSYISGFIEGWAATDGSVIEDDRLVIHSCDHGALDWLIENAPMGGWSPIGYREDPSSETNYGVRKHKVRCVTLSRKPAYWRVQQITPLPEEEVFCAIVPKATAFALAGGVYTGNCFVSPDIQDAMDTDPDQPGLGIMDALKVAALTQQMGGGIGMDFSTIRPKGALVKRTGSVSSGVLPFMDMWHAMCGTIMSSGSRRGAMMGTLRIDHPDILDFIEAKRTPGRLTNFNVSVLVTDAFMEAVEKGGLWTLQFGVPPAEGNICQVPLSDPPVYVYKTLPARDLWDKIIQNTYVYAEPGVIFLDQINRMNNLQYCEYIHATNPCGEQCLPPNGDCNLGHLNLAVMVKDPFTLQAALDTPRLVRAARALVRFLDNVLDVAQFPTEAQYREAMNKRRLGIGYTGLANALAMLGIRYGSPEAVQFTETVGQLIRNNVYDASAFLAAERGSFLLYDQEKLEDAPFFKSLHYMLRGQIREYGLRNGVLMSLAPTGTVSILAGNVSSGLEPVFLNEYQRKVLRDDGGYDEYIVYDYGVQKYRELHPEGPLPDYFVTSAGLTVDEHLAMQAAAQKYVDASISKTINCPKSMGYEEFREVYTKAWKLGLKGVTTYRPDPRSGRGSVLSEPNKNSAAGNFLSAPEKVPMLDVAEATRYRIKWPNYDESFYVTITNYVDEHGQRRPFELFINSKNAQHDEWTTALSVLITALFRRGGDSSFITEELRSVHAISGGRFMPGGVYAGSLVAAIGVKIEEHMRGLGLLAPALVRAVEGSPPAMPERCPKCQAPALVHEEGCRKCKACGASECG